MMGLGRVDSQWEETLYDLTPVEQHGELLFKREDKFAPLGYGSINGSKLRQLIWLVWQYKMAGGNAGLLSGASVKSPQLSMGPAVASHFGLPSTHVIGATTPTASILNPDVKMATMLGATFEYSKVAYNGALQSMVQKLLNTKRYYDYFHLEYGVSLNHKTNRPKRIEAFHRIGAEQVRNIPECDTLIIPSGSCNSLTSILYGLHIYRPKIKKLALIEIGPNRKDWVKERLLSIKVASKEPVDSVLQDYEIERHDLHGSKYVTYQETMDYSYHGIDFHSRYEGKVMTYLADRAPGYLNKNNVMWIIGGESKVANMEKALESVN